MKKVLLLLFYFSLTSLSLGSTIPKKISWDGIITNTTGTPITTPVNITFSIYDQGVTCLLYEETHTSITPAPDGNVSIFVGNGTTTGNDQGLTFETIFQNATQILPTSTANCTGGYTPGAGHNRVLRTTINGEIFSPDLVIGAVPFASSAGTLQGKTSADFLSIGGGTLTGEIITPHPISLTGQAPLNLGDSASGVIGLKAPATVTNYDLTFPAADGSANQVLTTNGAGILSWTTPSGGGLSNTLNNGYIFVGDGANTAVGVPMTGDVTISNTGVTTLAASLSINTSQILDGTISDSDIGSISAIKITTTATGTISATNLDAAIAEIDAEKQPLDPELTVLAGLTPAASSFIVGSGSTWTTETGDTARVSLGLGTTDSPSFSGISVGTTTFNITNAASGSIAIGAATPRADAVLDIVSSTKGLYIPTLDASARASIISPDNGLLIYNSTANRLNHYNTARSTWEYVASGGQLRDADGDTQIELEQSVNNDTIIMSTAGVARLTIGATGTVAIPSIANANPVTADASGVLGPTVSDERLKEEIQPLEIGLKEVMSIRPKTFWWKKESGFNPDQQQAGFIAQQIRPFIPYAVGEDQRGRLTFNDIPVLAATVKAIQEQQKLIENLQLENKDLKDEIKLIKMVICDQNPESAICL